MIYTKNQQEALDYRGGNLLIIACAGSGKTQVLSRRIALLVSEGVPKESIIAFTFTDMAAGELKSRIRKELASLREEGRIDDASLGEIYIGTIHSFSLQLLKEIHPSYRNYDIIDEKRQAAIIVSKYLDFGLDKLQGANSKIETIRRFIETLNIIYRENLDVDNLKNQDLINSVHQYQNFIKQRPNCFLTFDEIIAELTSVIESNEAIRAQVQNRFTIIFVDEYQDVDDRQEQLIRLLSNDGQTAAVCAVGDDDQAIYRFRGATVTNILTFEDRYPSVNRITLSTNFRSSHAIVEIANAAVSGQRIGRRNILGLHRRLPKTMKAQHYNAATNQFEETMAEHGDVWNCTFSSENQEATFIADKIQELLGIPWNSAGTLRGLSYADMSILCRSLNYTNGQWFCSLPATKPPPTFLPAQAGCKPHRTPLSLSAAPAGITHYTLQARSCAKGETKPPFGNPWFCRRVATVRIPAPVSPPLQNPKKRRRPAPPRADLRRFFVRPAGRDGRKNALEKLRFRVAFFDISGYNKLNPNRRLQHERSG